MLKTRDVAGAPASWSVLLPAASAVSCRGAAFSLGRFSVVSLVVLT